MNATRQELPILKGEPLYIPFVGAIIERQNGEKKQILIQIRQKESDPMNTGTIEIPGGKMRAFEDVYQTVRREVKEESGLDIVFIEGEKKQADSSVLIEPFCVTQMKTGPFIGLIFLCQAVGEPASFTEESRDACWIDVLSLRQIVFQNPERIYPPFLAPLKKYLL